MSRPEYLQCDGVADMCGSLTRSRTLSLLLVSMPVVFVSRSVILYISKPFFLFFRAALLLDRDKFRPWEGYPVEEFFVVQVSALKRLLITGALTAKIDTI